MFRMKDGIASLRPVGDSGMVQGPKDAQEQTEQPVLLQNLQSFLADKLQMADRYDLCLACGPGALNSEGHASMPLACLAMTVAFLSRL